MQYNDCNKNNRMLLVYFSLLTFCILLWFPYISLPVILLGSVVLSTRYSHHVMAISFSLLAAITAATIDPNYNEIGDVVFYYNEYINKEYLDSILNLKFGRLAVFNIMSYFDLTPRFYTFISIFVICLNFFYYGFIILDTYGVKIDTIKKKMFFLIALQSGLPLYLASSFENTLGFSFVFLSFAFHIREKRLISTLLVAVAVLFHSSVLFFVFVFFVTTLSYKARTTIVSSLTLFILLLVYTLSRYEFLSGIKYIDLVLSRFYKYVNGPWSVYIGGWEYLLLITVIVKVAFVFFLLHIIKRNKTINLNDKIKAAWLYRFLLIYAIFATYFLNYRTLGLRYVYVGLVFVYPYVYMLVMNLVIGQIKKHIALLFILFSFFSGPNINYLKGMKEAKFGSGNTMLLTWREIHVLPLHIPYTKFSGLSRTQRVEAAIK